MNDDLFKPISQGSDFEEIAENCKINDVTNAILRCCRLYASELRGSKENVNQLELPDTTYRGMEVSEVNMQFLTENNEKDKNINISNNRLYLFFFILNF